MTKLTRAPESLPVLSRGKHRNPRKGACFMEFASYLSGERWSDHPTCTHPLLGALARAVNDYTSDAGRSRLAMLVPSVIGLTSADPRVDARIALGCARVALPVVAAESQRVMAVSILTAERVLADLEHRPRGTLEEQSRQALEQVPAAAQWAEAFTRKADTSAETFRRNGAPATVRGAVLGVAEACIPAPDDVLRAMLVGAINDCAALTAAPTAAVEETAALTSA